MSTALKTLFNSIVNGALPATTITTVQTVLENMFTIVKVVGETITFKLADSLGGGTFDLTWHWETIQMENGDMCIKVWDALPDNVRAAIAVFVQQNMPSGTFVHFIRDPESIKSMLESLKIGGSIVYDQAGKTLTFAGKVFEISGFFPTVVISIILKILFRCLFDKVKPTLKKIGQDVATAVVSTGAVWLTKFVILSTVVHPPVAIVWVASFVIGAGCAKGVKTLIKGK